MSSTPFKLGLKVVDDFKYDPPFEGAKISFIMRGKDEKDTVAKLIKILNDVPDNMEMLIYHIGFRPDKPIPVARYFIEAKAVLNHSRSLVGVAGLLKSGLLG